MLNNVTSIKNFFKFCFFPFRKERVCLKIQNFNSKKYLPTYPQMFNNEENEEGIILKTSSLTKLQSSFSKKIGFKNRTVIGSLLNKAYRQYYCPLKTKRKY